VVPDRLLRPLTLPCGTVLANRLAKSALTERLSDPTFAPSDQLVALYRAWAKSGAGLLITGNVMIDRTHIESAGNVVIDADHDLDALRAWAAAGRGTQLWMQLNHPGRQASIFSDARPISASDVALAGAPKWMRPREMNEAEIDSVISRFARAARVAKHAGFTGVQVHAGHGYLLSQFLSPRTNLRTDVWGGDLERRARLLLSIVREIRDTVGPRFPISVKLNASDFCQGGQCEEDAIKVARMLAAESVDLLEISGGSYENLAFLRETSDRFVAFARRARDETAMPLMITGGLRTHEGVEAALDCADAVGMGRPFLSSRTFGQDFLSGRVDHAPSSRVRAPRSFTRAAVNGFHHLQMQRLARGRDPRPHHAGLRCVVHLARHELASWAKKRRRGRPASWS
jgi:2,4-dienoyl-CoA reductase-like NADH-dependent reductase (Old Yellow Enzyme family)